jgi:hypothetical protein
LLSALWNSLLMPKLPTTWQFFPSNSHIQSSWKTFCKLTFLTSAAQRIRFLPECSTIFTILVYLSVRYATISPSAFYWISVPSKICKMFYTECETSASMVCKSMLLNNHSSPKYRHVMPM